ncbi:23S rRNA (adenine(2030)-N(6))-methyltransferase RlmJ [Ferrimonas sediminicola]|uniref:Ribosomal RNA large subunit methyltransferase J n=1 Tax=Ferrimonas sediminicola TaxID=2569538 RepID=A0A4U1BC11_9GAMM|nr:23S rRNA (adenine(2030)-N(6))-methyltransferase RlmJ [Ferrimonas sediminicola]TKB48183.1 23S rRNA (adenine(2030)-N(6))-methyltransferase RlmJ [Ferrimonas sediminicola]
MLSYRHSFHAGNHADVLKHTVQALILESLKRKEKPFVAHDTHSGVGRYDLTSEHAEKTGEYVDGIGRLWGEDCPEELHPYLKAVKALNPSGNLRYYPGSPLLTRALIRDQDRMVLTELHPSDFPLLKQEFARDRRVRVYQEDGYARLKASLPPQERRGVVLIDPPYELKGEYQDLVKGVKQGIQRWATGTYAIWYPVVRRQEINRLEKALEASGIRKILQIELNVTGDTHEFGMTGSGMIVINPPWTLEQQMLKLLPWLTDKLAQDEQANFRVRWIVPE